MKKKIALLIVIVLCLGMAAACNSDSGSTSSPTTSESPSGSTSGAGVIPGVPQGYLEDDVDHYARDTYSIGFLSDTFSFLQQSWYEGMVAFEQRLNIKMTSVDGQGSEDTYLANLELIETRGFDGVITICPPQVRVRASELLNESGVPWIAFVNTILDDNDRTVSPNVILDQYETGRRPMMWLIENYKTYWGDVDPSKVALIVISTSTSVDLWDRVHGPIEIFNEYFPEGTQITIDCAATGLTGMAAISEETTFDLVTATVSANPDIEYWMVTGSTEFFGVGSSRALEAMGYTPDNALVCVVGHGVNVVDWQSMTDDTVSVNMACLMISDLLYAAPAVSGIIALIDGRTTYDTMWLEKTPANYKHGNDFGVWEVENRVVTRWNYQDYFDEVNAMLEM